MKDMDPAAREYAISRTPMDRTGEADEIANVVLFLCSSGASYVNGTICKSIAVIFRL